MSVVFGYRQLEGTLVGADCRITVRRGPKPDLHVDFAQKIQALTPQTVLGFAGDFEVARTLIEDLRRDFHGQSRKDPVSLLRRLPRFFRAKYSARPAWAAADQHVQLLVASTLPGRCNRISRPHFFQEMLRFSATGWSSPPPLVQATIASSTSSRGDFVRIPGESADLMYVMRSPDFWPRHIGPLDGIAIGEGAQLARTALLDVAPLAHTFSEQMFDIAVVDFLRKTPISTVGGLHPMVRLYRGVVSPVMVAIGVGKEGKEIETAYENGRFVQRNKATGREIRLRLAWEITAVPTRSDVFDDREILNRTLLREAPSEGTPTSS